MLKYMVISVLLNYRLESGETVSVTVSDRNADVHSSGGICFSWDDVSLFDVTSGRNIGYIEKGRFLLMQWAVSDLAFAGFNKNISAVAVDL